MGLGDLLDRYKQEVRAFRALLTDAEGRHVYPMLAPDGSLRYTVVHMPEGEWNALEVLRTVRLFLLQLAAAARSNKDPGCAQILERCASMLDAAINYHVSKGGSR